MSYHQIEDLVEDAIRLIVRLEGNRFAKRDLIYHLYRFHDRYDTSYTRLRLRELLVDHHYLYQFPVDRHPDYAEQRDFLERDRSGQGAWIPADFSGEAKSVYLLEGQLYCELGDAFWQRIKGTLPLAEQELPEALPLPRLFHRLLEIGRAQNETTFLKRWYATWANSLLDGEFDPADGVPPNFEAWLQDPDLLQIRTFAEAQRLQLHSADPDYADDDLLALPDLSEELELTNTAEERAKTAFLLDLQTPLAKLIKAYRSQRNKRPRYEKYRLIYQFFREKLGEHWRDGIVEDDRAEGMYSFLNVQPYPTTAEESFYACLLLEYSTEFKLVNLRIGIQRSRILDWQGRAVSAQPELQHFNEAPLAFGDEAALHRDPDISNWGGWKFSLKHSEKTLRKRLTALWDYYEQYSPRIYQFHRQPLTDWAGIADSQALMDRRRGVLDQDYSFFGNEMDFKLAVARLNQELGRPALAEQYAAEVRALLEEELGSDALQERIRRGLEHLRTGTGAYPEISQVFSQRL
ncbi:MAG: hypothetical protein AAFW73_05925 [Bacteroidota bacterium]